MPEPFTFYRDEGDAAMAYAPLEEALSAFIDADVPLAAEVVFVSEEEIRRLNREQRGVDRVTDVLSFPALALVPGRKICGKNHPFGKDENGNLLLGSVVICTARAREQAEEYGHSYERELHYLLVHGVMHCLGYDHMEEGEKSVMRAAEEKVLSQIGITRD